MTIIQIHTLHPQSLQAFLTRLLRILGCTINAPRAILINHIRKLCREEDILARARVAFEPGTDEIFIVAVHVCGIPVQLPGLVRSIKDSVALGVGLGIAVEGGEALTRLVLATGIHPVFRSEQPTIRPNPTAVT